MKQHQFLKKDRLTRRPQYLRLTARGHKVVGRHFLAVFAPGESSRSRLGITVTRKVGTAVQRNRIKRLVREYFRQQRMSLSAAWDINIIARYGAARESNSVLKCSLAELFARINPQKNRDAQYH